MNEMRGIDKLERGQSGGLDQELIEKMQIFIEQAKNERPGAGDTANAAPLAMLRSAEAPAVPGDGRE